jgi:Fe-S cluster assembly protein SufB
MPESDVLSTVEGIGEGAYRFGFNYPEHSVLKTKKGVDEDVVRAISAAKG